MRKAIMLLLVIAGLCAGVYGQDYETPASPETISSWLDFAAYKIDNYPDFAMVEFFYGVLRHDLTFEDLDSFYEAAIDVSVEIFNDKGAVVDTLFKRIATRANSIEDMGRASIRIIDAMQALMRPGNYSVKVIVEDVNSQIDNRPLSGKYGERQIKIEVPDFSKADKVDLSTVELAYKIEVLPEIDSLDINPLHKSGRNIIPNPSGIFLNTDSLMYFYAEIYNLAFEKGSKGDYFINYRIVDPSGTVVADYGKRKYSMPGTSAIVSSAIDIADLPEGQFTFMLEVEDGQSLEIASASKNFSLMYQTFELAPAVAEEQFDEEDAILMEKIMRYYATKDEKALYKNSNLDGKKEVIKAFWNRRDPNPDTRLNEFKQEAFRRYNVANQKYSVNMIDKSDGWNSDRGRVFMLYGEPDEVEFHPSSMDIEPYERWIYYSYPKQGKIYFIFVDDTGFGNYVLKHSTAQGEVVNYDWEEKIQTNDPSNSGF